MDSQHSLRLYKCNINFFRLKHKTVISSGMLSFEFRGVRCVYKLKNGSTKDRPCKHRDPRPDNHREDEGKQL